MMLAVVVHLTEIAGYSALRTGLAVSLLPVAATASSNLPGRLAGRVGSRTVAVPGMLFFTASSLWPRPRAGHDPNYPVDVLSGLLLVGAGIGTGPAILKGAGVSDVDPAHSSVAGAVTQTARQVAGPTGVAILVAILRSNDSSGANVDAFQQAFLYLAFVAALASQVAASLPAQRGARRLEQR